MIRKIKKVKIKSNSLEVELTETHETEGGPVTNEVIMKCAGLVHDDLRKAITKLALHMIVICDLRKSELINDDTFTHDDISDFDEYKVHGFSTGGEDEHEGVVLIGSRKFTSGKVLNITTPFTKYSDENFPYEYEAELYNDIEACVFETELYLQGKYAVKQLELPFDEVEELEQVEVA